MGMVLYENPCVTGCLRLGQEVSQALEHVLPILIVYDYLPTLYPPES